MKVTRFTTHRVAPRWLFLKVETDAGITGWGEPVIEGRARTVEAAVHELAEYVVGRDPAQINDIWQTLYRGGFYRGGPVLMSAIAGIDQALWDIKGKALGVPVYELLGGRVRDRMRTYRWVGGDRPAELVAAIGELLAAGFDTFKFNGSEELAMLAGPRDVAAVVARVAAVREAFGDRVDFGIDFHGRVAAPMARVLLREFEAFRPLFVEEPVLPEQAEHYRRLADSTSIPLAAGERMYSRFDFKRVLADGGLAILQPDPSHAGGITECHKIAAMAEAHDVAFAPHCPLGPIALAACLQLDFVAYNAVLQEHSIGIHYNQGADLLDYVVNREDFRIDRGCIAALPRPGLGVEIDEARVIAASRNAPDWRNPVWRHADGSVAEW